MFQRITHTHSSRPAIKENPLSSILKLTSGKVFRGTVIQNQIGGKILVSTKGGRFIAYSDINLKEGQKYNFQVKSAGPRVLLKVLNGETLKMQSPSRLWASGQGQRAKLPGILKTLSAAPNFEILKGASIKDLQNLSQLLPSIIYSGPKDGDGLWLPRFMTGSGLFWENKVARYLLAEKIRPWKKTSTSDLKGILLSLKNNLMAEDHDNPKIKSLALKVQQALHLIEQDQFLNLSSVREGIGWYWFIPGNAEKGFKQAELFIKKKSENNGTNFSMLLDFTMLGRMEVRISLVESAIGMEILVEDMEKAALVTESLSLLEANLKDVGMLPGVITCGIKKNEGTDISFFSHLQGHDQSVDLVI